MKSALAVKRIGATKAEIKMFEKVNRSMFAEHLYDGLTRKKNYGLVEATRHWHAAKSSPLEYAFIEFPGIGTNVNNVMSYLVNHDENVKQLEDYLRDMGTLKLTYEELDALAIARKES